MSRSTPNHLRIVIMAGGTGGHVFPALAVADVLRTQGVEVSWLGTRHGLEAEVIPQAGYPIDYLAISGLRGKGVASWLLAPVRLVVALAQGLRIMRRRQPSAVLGMGGFVTGPGGLAAWLMRRPLLIHEQNARAGLTNRLLRPLASYVMQAFPGTFGDHVNTSDHVLLTGNPLREAFLKISRPAMHGGALRLLVVGGSLGAAHFNDVVPQALSEMNPAQRPEVWHQSGKRNIEQARSNYSKLDVEARIDAFIEDIATAYAWADLVLCRAGAMTISELAATGVASILVPYPYAVDDHQTANARYLADREAAVLLPQPQFTAGRLSQLLKDMTVDSLRQMAEEARRLAMPNASRDVADVCLSAASGVPHG